MARTDPVKLLEPKVQITLEGYWQIHLALVAFAYVDRSTSMCAEEKAFKEAVVERLTSILATPGVKHE